MVKAMKRIKTITAVCLLILQTFTVSEPHAQQRDQMSKDSTDLVPFDPITLVPPVTNTATANGVMPGSITYTPQCGPSDSSYLPSAPSTFLCNSGQPSVVDTIVGRRGTETYSWTCTGNNPGDPNNVAYCSAQKKVLGTCGSADGQTLSTQPTPGQMCATGSPTGYNQFGNQATWSCDGTPYTISATCSATINPPAWQTWEGAVICFGGQNPSCPNGSNNDLASGVRISNGRAIGQIVQIFDCIQGVNCNPQSAIRTVTTQINIDIKNILTDTLDFSLRLASGNPGGPGGGTPTFSFITPGTQFTNIASMFNSIFGTLLPVNSGNFNGSDISNNIFFSSLLSFGFSYP
jgi:hypothetical protein